MKKLVIGLMFINYLIHTDSVVTGPLWPQNMVVVVPMTNVMGRPLERPESYQKCSDQSTQLVFGEHVVAYEEYKGLIRIKAVEQPAFWNGVWTVCGGWVKKEHLAFVKGFPQENLVVVVHTAPLKDDAGRVLHEIPFGAKLVGARQGKAEWTVTLYDGKKAYIAPECVRELTTHDDSYVMRQEIVLRSAEFLGDPYVWGGRSAYNPSLPMVSGVDCSGLVNLLYRSIGFTIPRSSHDQYEKGTKISSLSPADVGDLVFLYYEDPSVPGTFSRRIGHVLVYLGNDRLLEAEGEASGHVRIVYGRQRFGKQIEAITSGEEVWSYRQGARSPLGNAQVVLQSSHGKAKVVFASYLRN